MHNNNTDILTNLFKDYIKGWSWKEWQAAGASDREEVVVNALAELGPDMDIEEAYDIFYDWCGGLTPEYFEGIDPAEDDDLGIFKDEEN